MNTKKLHTLFLRLTIALCALLAAGLNSWADDDLKDLSPISGYYFQDASALATGSSKFFSSDSKFYVYGSNSSYGSAISGTWTAKNGTKDPVTQGFNSQNTGKAIAFQIAEGMKCKVFVNVYHTSGDTRYLYLLKGDSNGIPSTDEDNQYQPTDANALCATATIGKGEIKELSYDIEGSSSDYYFLTAGSSTVYILAIEVVPYISTPTIDYGIWDSTNKVFENQILEVSEFSASNNSTGFTADKLRFYGQIEGDSDNGYVHMTNPSVYTLNYGNNKTIWSGSKPLTWTQVFLENNFFTNMTCNTTDYVDKIIFYGTPTSSTTTPSTASFNVDNNWDTGHTYQTNAFTTDGNGEGHYTFVMKSSTLDSIKVNGLFINASDVTITRICYEPQDGNTVWYNVANDGLITLNDTPFSNEVASATISMGDFSNTDGYTLIAGKDLFESSSVAYYFKGAAEHAIPIKVTSNQTSLYSVDPIKWYYKITADNMSVTTGANFGDGHFYVVGGEDTDDSYGGSVEFANGQTITVGTGYKTKWATDGVSFQIEPGVKAQVRVYINGAAGRCIALREGSSKLSDATLVTYKQGAGAGTITTLTADIVGETDKYFYITGYKDDTFIENNIYVVGIEVIPYLANPWVWYDNGTDSKNCHYVTINKDTNPPYVTGFNPQNVRYGGVLTDGTTIYNYDSSSGGEWIEFHCKSTDNYQLDYYYSNNGTGANDGNNVSSFTVDDNGIIRLNQSKFSNLTASIYYRLEGVHAVIEKGKTADDAVAYYFYPYQFTIDSTTGDVTSAAGISGNPTTLDVTADLEDVLSVTLTGPRYENNFVYYDDVNTIPVPYVLFNGNDVTSSATIGYTVTWIADLENSSASSASYSVGLTWDSTNQENSITLKSTDNTTLDPSKDIYNNALFKVSYTVDYSYTNSNNETVTMDQVARSYYLVVMCPKYTFHKIGSDAKLIVNSENSTLTGWDSGETVTGYDEYGVYYASIAWHLMHSWSMYPEMFSSYYRIEYDCYKCSDKGTTSKYAQGTNKSGDYKSGTRLQPRGQSGLTDGMEITCDDSDNRYLDVRVYAKGSQLKSNSSSAVEEVLVSKCHYKFILFTPPTIQSNDGSEAKTTGAIQYSKVVSSTPVQITSGSASNTDYTTAYKGTRYTTDGSLPMNMEGDNVRTPSDDSSPFKGTKEAKHTTVYYAADFYNVLPYYTGEGGKSNDSGTNEPLAILSDKYMYIVDPGEIYSVHYDPLLIYREGNSRDGDLKLDSDNNVTHTDATFTPTDAALNARIRAALKVPSKAYESGNEQDEQSLHLMLGSQNVMEYRGVKDVYGFYLGGIQWTVDPDTGFDEYIDDFENPLWGENWVPGEGGSSTTVTKNDGTTEVYDSKNNKLDINGNPYTECNGGIGGQNTESGGMFLQPVGGDFFRMEPEFDGVCTMWIRQNGASDSKSTSTGYLSRRPVYVVDENGKIMERSNIKPTVESYYCVDGTYAVISGRNTFRRDFEETWRRGLLNWTNAQIGVDNSSSVQSDGVKDIYRMYSRWFNSIKLKENNDKTIDFSNSEYVDRYDKMSPIIYRNKYMSDVYEDPSALPSFAKYGYELPNFSYVRYRIPMKAGKSYYLGGRGTKNGLAAIQFEGMPANYDPIEYIDRAENKIVDTEDYTKFDGTSIGNGKVNTFSTAITTEMVAEDKIKNRNNTTPLEIRSSYNTSESYPMYHLYEDGTTKIATSATGDPTTPATNIFSTLNGKVNENAGVGRNKYPTIDFTLHRTFTAGYWHPIVLPFSVSETRMKEIFGDEVVVLYLDPYDNSLGTSGNYTSVINPAIGDDLVLRFTHHYYEMLYANTPAFICPGGKINKVYDEYGNLTSSTDVTTIVDPVFRRVTYQSAGLNYYDSGNTTEISATGYKISNGTNGAYWIKGTYTETTLGSASDNKDHGIYYMSNSGTSTDSNGNTIENVASVYHLTPGATVTMKPTRVWIEWVPATSSSGMPPRLASVGYQSYEGYELEEAPETNAIYDIIADEVVIPGYDDDTVYDMMGRIVAKGGTQGLAPGFYIYQGRKVAVK